MRIILWNKPLEIGLCNKAVTNYQNNFLINNPIFNSIGKWSYSIYVWHWPLVVLGFYFAIENWWLYGIPLSILLGFLSHQFIEKINFPRYSSWKDIYKIKPFYVFLIILGCGYAVKKTDGADFHYSKEIIVALEELDSTNPYKCDSQLRNRDVEECEIGNQDNIKAIVIGDSHADSLTTAVASAFNLEKEGIISIVTASCPLLLNANVRDASNNDDCQNINKKRFQLIESKKYENIPIVLISRLPVYLEGQNDVERVRNEGEKAPLYFSKNESLHKNDLYKITSKDLTETLCQISKHNPVYITYPVPEFSTNIPKAVAKNLFFNESIPITMSYKEYLSRASKSRIMIANGAKSCGAKVLDPTTILCPKNECISIYKNRPIYRDADHLSEYGNKLLTPMFKDALNP